MVDIGLRRGASFSFTFGAAAEKLAILVVRFARLRQTVARRLAVIEMQHNLSPARLDDVGVARGRSAEHAVARMICLGLR